MSTTASVSAPCADVGSDTLPFEILSKKPENCRNTVFADIDYPALIKKKCEIVSRTVELHDLLDNTTVLDHEDGVLLRSKQYMAVGCDLNDVEKLHEIVAMEFDIFSSEFLFVAEVSTTYMDTTAANKLIAWAATLKDGECPTSEAVLNLILS